MDTRSRVDHVVSNAVQICIPGCRRVSSLAGLSKVLQTSPQCRKARQAFQAYIVLAPLTGILVIALTINEG